MLGGIPTIVYGYFALLFVTPLLQTHLPATARLQHALGRPGDGHHDRPYIEFAVRRRDARGADEHARRRRTRWARPSLQTALFRGARRPSGPGLVVHPGISRAVGETMVVAIAAGMQPNLTFNPLEPAATITAYIVQVALGDLPHGSIGYQTIFAAGLTLLLITLAVQHRRPPGAQALP
jgi:phosphate transport system permease protein